MKCTFQFPILTALTLLGLAACGGGGGGGSSSAPPAGTLDTSFGSGGKVTTAIGAYDDYAFALALAPDGKIVVAGTSYGPNRDFALARYNADGSLDTPFGSGGKVVTAIGTNDDFAYALALAPDGRIVVAGTSFVTGTNYDFALARYNADGSLDTSFGSGGKVTTAFGSGTDDAYAIALAPDGKIVVAGRSHNGMNYDFALARYNANGSLDTSFGSGGKVVTAFGATDEAIALALAPDGKIVLAGYSLNGTNLDFALARYNSDGTLDTSFGIGGKVVTAIGSGNDEASALALAPDGKIMTAGRSHNGMNYDFALVRYNSDGTLDTSFGSGGKVVTAIGAGDDLAFDLAFAPDSRVVVTGASDNGANLDFALARYNADGSLDTSFGSGGKVVTAIGAGNDAAYAVALAPDGKIVLAGRSRSATNDDFALARYYY